MQLHHELYSELCIPKKGGATMRFHCATRIIYLRPIWGAFFRITCSWTTNQNYGATGCKSKSWNYHMRRAEHNSNASKQFRQTKYCTPSIPVKLKPPLCFPADLLGWRIHLLQLRIELGELTLDPVLQTDFSRLLVRSTLQTGMFRSFSPSRWVQTRVCDQQWHISPSQQGSSSFTHKVACRNQLRASQALGWPPHGALICFMICCWLLIFSRTCATLRDAPCGSRLRHQIQSWSPYPDPASTFLIINYHRNWAQLLAPDRSCPASRSLGMQNCSWGC